MKSLETLLKYFPTGTTEGERHILRKAFVQLDEYADIISPPPFSPRVLIGKKGSGKSAIIDFSMAVFKLTSVPAVQLKPLDLELGAIPETASVGEVTRIAFQELSRTIARTLGSSVSGLVSEQDKVLYEEAVTAGLRDRNTVDKLAHLLPKLAKPLTEVDISSLLPTTSVANRNQLLKAIKSNLEESQSGFYLFIDDTDQVAAPDRPGHLNRIWGFLLAARELAQKIEQLRCVISLREEVWRRITSDRAGQRDQTDHFAGLVRFLSPTRTHIHKIIERRIELAARELAPNSSETWKLFFEPENPLIPTTDQRSSWPDLIVVRSRERPRDAVQLVNALAQVANTAGFGKIPDDLFAKEMIEFSKQRVSLLAQESEFDCPQIEQVIRTFSDLEYDHGSFKAKSETIKDHLLRNGANFGLQLFGRSLKPGDEDDAFQLWKYLFDVGFLNARVADTRERDGYRHVYPREDPNYVSKSRWNDMQATAWEIGPSYRDFLISLQQEHAARTGLPPKIRKRR
ncbi:P-loop ATPase, Sll1717 family [Desulfobulbus oligotrophicus]|uniref:Uncharacterized protein n=1 Tax=Desulfobulbus oligotrophicus TaxID=1909699 RepID=A0A7T6APN3_9BACT|nr:hypothetical protein [Desulfobulbus oligotrophicus]QQG64550.1 hypothetical protein HP555_01100 [Desulfobulbus oligotrophicus]